MSAMSKVFVSAVAAAALATGTLAAPAASAATASYKLFLFPQMGRGDCHQTNAMLTVQSDGLATFSDITWTDHTHSGDVWHARFVFQTWTGTTVFVSPTLDSPRMDDGHPSPRYHWSGQFRYDPGIFPSVNRVGEIADC